MEEDSTLREALLNRAEEQKQADIVQVKHKNLYKAFHCDRTFNLFQFCCFLALLFSFSLQGLIAYNLYLFELEPQYLWRFSMADHTEGLKAPPFVPCDANELDKALEWKLDSSRDDLNLDNWYTRLNFQTVESWKIGMIGALYFIGYIAGSTYFPRLADIYGRKPFVVAGGFMQSISTIALIYSNNFILIYANMIILGIASPFLASIGYNYILELIPESFENPVNTLIMMIDAFGSLVGIFYFSYFSKDIDSFLLIVGIIGLVSSALHCLTPESPVFLDKASDLMDIEGGRRLSNVEEREQTSIWDFITKSSLRNNILVMICVWSTTSAGYYLINFNMKYVGGSIMSNIVASWMSEIIADLFAFLIFEYYGSKASLILFFSISGVAGAVGWFEFSSPTIITGIVLTARFGVAASYCVIYITTVRIFPSVYSATAFGICNIFAKVVTALIPILVECPDPFPMLFLAITCFSVWFSVMFLDETKQHDKGNDSDEKVQES